MAAEFLSGLRGLFRETRPDEGALEQVSRAIDKLTAARRTLEEEISRAIERLSEDVDRCLQHQLLHLEWEERARQAKTLDPADRSGLLRQAARESERHREQVKEYRDSADREEAVVRSLEQRRVEIDRHLERILRERDVARTASGLAAGRDRLVTALAELGSATGLDFLDALETLRRQSEEELALAEAREQLEEEALRRRR